MVLCQTSINIVKKNISIKRTSRKIKKNKEKHDTNDDEEEEEEKILSLIQITENPID